MVIGAMSIFITLMLSCISLRPKILKNGFTYSNRKLHSTLSPSEIFEMITPKLSSNESMKIFRSLVEMELESSFNTTLLIKDHKIEMMKKDYDFQVLKQKFEYEIASLEATILQETSACTARGILEYALKACHAELGEKGTCNAYRACEVLVKCMYVCLLSSRVTIYTYKHHIHCTIVLLNSSCR